MAKELERKIEIVRPAFDYILNPTKERGKMYGRGPVEMRFILRDDKVGITWGIYTGWELPETREALKNADWGTRDHPGYMGTAICTHVAEKNRDYFQDEPLDCDVLPGGKCYGDCGFLAGDELFKTLVREGEEAVWKVLEGWHAAACMTEEEEDQKIEQESKEEVNAD